MDWVKEIKAIGWDVDGTLYKPGTVPLNLIYDLQLKAIVDTTGSDPQKAKSEFERMYNQLHSRTAALNALGVRGEDFFVKVWDEFPFGEYVKKDLQLVAMFQELTGFTHFIISNSNREDQIETKLKLLGLNPALFAFMISTVELGAVKPDARPFLAALERLGPEFQAHPETVLYIGDRLETDVLGAHRVGMKAGLVWATSEAADVSFPTVYDIPKVAFVNTSANQGV